MSKFVVSGMRYDFPKPSNIGVSGNPLRAMNETNIKLAKVLILEIRFLKKIGFLKRNTWFLKLIFQKNVWSQRRF